MKSSEYRIVQLRCFPSRNVVVLDSFNETLFHRFPTKNFADFTGINPLGNAGYCYTLFSTIFYFVVSAELNSWLIVVKILSKVSYPAEMLKYSWYTDHYALKQEACMLKFSFIFYGVNDNSNLLCT